MAYTAIEVIALILITVTLIKLITISINKKSWMAVSEKVFNKPLITSLISLLLAFIVFYYLVQELTLAQIMATTAFITLLMVFGMMSYSKELRPLIKKAYTKKFNGAIILYTAIWLILILWASYEIIFT